MAKLDVDSGSDAFNDVDETSIIAKEPLQFNKIFSVTPPAGNLIPYRIKNVDNDTFNEELRNGCMLSVQIQNKGKVHVQTENEGNENDSDTEIFVEADPISVTYFENPIENSIKEETIRDAVEDLLENADESVLDGYIVVGLSLESFNGQVIKKR